MWTSLLKKDSALVDMAIIMGIGLLAMQMYRAHQEIQLNKKKLSQANGMGAAPRKYMSGPLY